MSIDIEILRDILEGLELNPIDFSELVNIPLNHLLAVLKGTEHFTLEEERTILSYFGVNKI
jgi:predicted transcriptional regulator